MGIEFWNWRKLGLKPDPQNVYARRSYQKTKEWHTCVECGKRSWVGKRSKGIRCMDCGWRNTRLCPICKLVATSQHHILPRESGGLDGFENITWLCKSCHDVVEEFADTEIYLSPNLLRTLRLALLGGEDLSDVLQAHYNQREAPLGCKSIPMPRGT